MTSTEPLPPATTRSRSVFRIRRGRRLLGVVVGAVTLLVASGLVPSSAGAASHAGGLLIRGPGSLYNGPNGFAALPIASGQTATFPNKVVNTGTTVAQFRVRMVTIGSGQVVNLYSGSIVLTTLAYDSTNGGGYYTAPIAPGGSQALTLKITAPVNTPQQSLTTFVSLYATDGAYLGEAIAQAEVKAPTYGTTAADVFARQGGQAYVGGSVSYQAAESPALNVGASTTFNVKLQNDGTFPVSIGASMGLSAAPCLAVTVKDGLTDVTNAVRQGTYNTFALAVHASRTLKITVKRTGAAGCGAYDSVAFSGFNTTLGVSHTENLVVPFPAV